MSNSNQTKVPTPPPADGVTGGKQPPLQNQNAQPGEGLRSLRTTTLFRVVNYELYAKPNIVIMSIGLFCFGSAIAYMAYMRSKYEGMGYYAALKNDGTEIYTKKQSRWDT